MKQLLGSAPHSNLICLEFPTYKALSAGGPPFGSPPEAYQELLSQPDEAGLDVKGPLQKMAHFHPERTHEIGKDENGKVRDFVAIWRHSPSENTSAS